MNYCNKKNINFFNYYLQFIYKIEYNKMNNFIYYKLYSIKNYYLFFIKVIFYIFVIYIIK